MHILCPPNAAVLGAFPAGCCYGNRVDKALSVLVHLDPTGPMVCIMCAAEAWGLLHAV
jgi:hypothetical protein